MIECQVNEARSSHTWVHNAGVEINTGETIIVGDNAYLCPLRNFDVKCPVVGMFINITLA